MKNESITLASKIKPASKTDWKRVISQTDNEIIRNAKSDPDSPVLNNKKYYKPEKIKL
jgi:hypothetical protein